MQVCTHTHGCTTTVHMSVVPEAGVGGGGWGVCLISACSWKQPLITKNLAYLYHTLFKSGPGEPNIFENYS